MKKILLVFISLFAIITFGNTAFVVEFSDELSNNEYDTYIEENVVLVNEYEIQWKLYDFKISWSGSKFNFEKGKSTSIKINCFTTSFKMV